MFTGKIIDRRDILSSHQSSAKHAACFMKDTSKTKHMTGLMDKATAKVNQNEHDFASKHDQYLVGNIRIVPICDTI
jgi:hypothetical protein